ncbi:zinc-dependent metalloprotease [Piscinibacter sp. HJYY11]|uniref:zinc-dependent metalloprotease n=1 Tax=Piscinibacter sp. HJYY11 TaxID=2801333 RepID=UPI00191FA263|nr:zinc-dependent metalloprotease [Piscinibacter sp. HJYY11]MBL0730165.1 zinc-dependent metalloprotease [Piscinibacter sp. HJYY11]
MNAFAAGFSLRPLGLALAVSLMLQACATPAPTTSATAKPTPLEKANSRAVPAPVGGATPPAPAAAAAASAAASGVAGTTPPRPEPGAPRPFDEVIKGATQQAGFVPIWRKDDRIWLEIPTERLDQPFLLSVNVAGSVGERGLYASQMGPSWLATFRKIGTSQMQLIALNNSFISSTPAMKAAVEQGFSHSLLGSAAIASAPHPQRKSVLIDAGFLLTDIPGYSTRIEAAFRMPYSLDRGNSFFEKTRVSDEMTTVNARVHFSTSRIPAPPLTPSPVPTPPPPSATPDARSMFVGFVYSFTKLPDTPMAPRRTDPRLGHFFSVVTDLGTDLKANPRVHHVSRWRLEKREPQAALSEPKQPIVYWLDRNIPPQYRKAVEAGVLEWNKAFEKIGFKNAIVVRQQPDDAEWDNMDARHASIRWFVGADVGFAVGPHHADPRTGEIIDADIGMSDVFGRSARRFVAEDVPRANSLGHAGHAHDAYCNYAHENAAEMNFALDLLEARGDIAPDSPEAEAFVQAVIKDTVMHEVGHTLGLKHNFKGSTVVARDKLQDKDYTEKNGISGSVMDYNAYNIALRGEKQGAMNNTTLGPYDYWAIEYAYKPIAPADEAAELARIASRSTDPLLAYADDADAGGIPGNDGIDPLVNRFDLGDDPLAYYVRRLQLSRELWQRVQERGAQPGDEAVRQRRVLLSGFRQLGRASELVGKYVGGMHTVRDLPGTTQRAAYRPVEPAKQREALKFLADGVFNADSFRFKPQFIASLSPDYNEWDRGGPVNIPAAVLSVQTVAMDRLLSPGTASRLLDLPSYVPDANKRNIISLAEVYDTLQGAVWSELKSGREIDRLRRNLQREHLKRVQNLLVRGSAALPPDALSLMRMQAVELQTQLKRASTNGKLSVESRAHLQDSLSQLTEALRASMIRS